MTLRFWRCFCENFFRSFSPAWCFGSRRVRMSVRGPPRCWAPPRCSQVEAASWGDGHPSSTTFFL
eukprot:8682673-Pyramimonas_sp.AAC.1